MLALTLATADLDIAAAARQEVARQECRLREEKDEILVCGRRDGRGRYQVTDPKKWDPTAGVDSVARERSSWIEQGDSGTGSCSAVGPGGWTGCMQKNWKRNRQQHKGWFY